ncbi:DUF4112 domain-containing protein [Sphingomonas lacunae]|uniref:DUF4112 domain-containing protein n=1 Tax=Sphingomonas lacunae TaxID=2698828 RepID=A0A6M4AWN7_9SPHN|nr:DUF4112 domain-containing protein [Sphingomonas lacunae]QJQ33537.1 DUF4112 domain-containing protein [Sphingomonas lacunae]
MDRLAAHLNIDTKNPAAIRQRVEMLEMLLERSLTIPGTRFPIGLDAVAGLIPVVGDFITAALGGYLVWEGRNLGMSRWQLLRMASNVGVDALIGAIPLVGDAADFVFRSNSRNLRIIKRHLDKHHPATRIIDATATHRSH